MAGDWWTKLKGAARFIDCARKQPAEDSVGRARAGVCAQCPSLTRGRANGLLGFIVGRGRLGFCGPRTHPTPTTCSCIVLAESEPGVAHVTIDGVPMRAAGKGSCEHEGCPQGKW